ncbi:glycosyltransferase [Aestuariicella sp. G3-2]|uniref:glycosyltransferase n=1 Tax=Pseudomaricurvus albidus TaxID=2842452 RepID=UPI001C0B50BF|nr:glycosyltransferase [Aestuariicella albida]MBU3071669.1 glycosyltransferase [Aestuariicella albida]
MKVLHFYKTYHPDSFGGVEQVIFQLSESSTEYGVEPQVLTVSRSGSNRDIPVSRHITHKSKMTAEIASNALSVAAISDFYELSREVDVVNFHYPWPFMDVVHFLTRHKKPCVVSYHSDIVRQKGLLQLYKPLMYRFLSSVDAIVVASPAYTQFSPVLAKYRDKIHVIPYGLDEHSYSQSTEAKLEEWRAKLPPKFFLFVGALRYYKGLQFLLDAACQTKLPIVIVGSGGVEVDLHAQAMKLGLDSVIFTGTLPEEDKNALLELCYGFVFPSHLPSEAFGISLLEGAMFSKPLISCEIGTGTTYINIGGQTGLVVPPGDSAALGEAMLKLWENPDLAQSLGSAARRRYLEIFKSSKMASDYAELYRSLL